MSTNTKRKQTCEQFEQEIDAAWDTMMDAILMAECEDTLARTRKEEESSF